MVPILSTDRILPLIAVEVEVLRSGSNSLAALFGVNRFRAGGIPVGVEDDSDNIASISEVDAVILNGSVEILVPGDGSGEG